jgi:hypothetical protein
MCGQHDLALTCTALDADQTAQSIAIESVYPRLPRLHQQRRDSSFMSTDRVRFREDFQMRFEIVHRFTLVVRDYLGANYNTQQPNDASAC